MPALSVLASDYTVKYLFRLTVVHYQLLFIKESPLSVVIKVYSFGEFWISYNDSLSFVLFMSATKEKDKPSFIIVKVNLIVNYKGCHSH